MDPLPEQSLPQPPALVADPGQPLPGIPDDLTAAAEARLDEILDPSVADPYAPAEAVAAASDLPSQADNDLLDDAHGFGPEGAYNLAETMPLAAWQKTLSQDLDGLEGQGEAFLTVAFSLYDKLLAAGDDAPALDGVAANRDLAEARLHYKAMLDAVTQLRADLLRGDIKRFLPLHGAEDQGEFLQVTTLFSGDAAADNKQKLVYNAGDRTSITALLFDDRRNPVSEAADGLTRPQQDALLLLDKLRQISKDLAFVSSTVTGWIHDTGEDSAAGEDIVGPYGIGRGQTSKRARH